MSDTNTDYNYGSSVTLQQTATGGDGSTSSPTQSPLVLPSYRVSSATNNTNNANTALNMNKNASFTSLSGSQRAAPPERIPSRRHLTNSSFAGGAAAPTVPSSRPGTPRDLEPSRSFSRSADTSALPYASSAEGGVGTNTVARGGAPQPPASKPQPLQVNAVQSSNTVATTATGASSDLPAPIVSRSSSPTKMNAGPPSVRPGLASRGNNNTASPSEPNASGSFVAAVAPSDTKIQNTAARPNENTPSRASPPSSRPPASAGSPKTTIFPLDLAPSSPRGSSQPTGLVAPSRESVVLASENGGDEDGAYTPLEVVTQSKPLRSGYEEALALASLPRDPDEEAVERERIARRERKNNKQKLNGDENVGINPKLEIGLPSSVVASESKKPSSVHLTSPSRDQFGVLNTIDRRHLHSAPKCEKLFQYEEPLEYGPTNREAMVWSPAVTASASDRYGGGIRRGGGGDHQNFPPPVGLTLYEFRGGAASLHGRAEDAEEPYEGRNDLVRQLREYELRQFHQDDLKQHRNGSTRQPHANERNNVGKRKPSLRSGPPVGDDHDYYFANGFGSGNSRADPQQQQQQYDTTPGYFDLMYGGGEMQVGARGGAYDDQAPYHYGGGAQPTAVRAPAGVSHHQRTNSPRPNHPSARAGSRGPSQAQHQHLSAAPAAPSYGSTYAEFARGGENKIVRSFPSEWRVGTNLHQNQLEDSAVPHPKQGGGVGGGYVSLNQSVASSRQQSIDRYGPRRQSVGVIAGRTPYEN